MIKDLAEDLDKINFYLNSRNFTRASYFSFKALELLRSIPKIERPDEDYLKTLNSLKDSISSLRKCAAMSQPGYRGACTSEAKKVYRYSLILSLLSTGRIKDLVKARRTAYAAVALGLPTATLFGLTPLAIGLIFMGILWTYFYFARLKLIGWVVLVGTLMLLLPFLINAVSYFAQAVFNTTEIGQVAEALEISPFLALLLILVLLIISSISLILNIYSLLKLIKYRAVFE